MGPKNNKYPNTSNAGQSTQVTFGLNKGVVTYLIAIFVQLTAIRALLTILLEIPLDVRPFRMLVEDKRS